MRWIIRCADHIVGLPEGLLGELILGLRKMFTTEIKQVGMVYEPWMEGKIVDPMKLPLGCITHLETYHYYKFDLS